MTIKENEDVKERCISKTHANYRGAHNQYSSSMQTRLSQLFDGEFNHVINVMSMSLRQNDRVLRSRHSITIRGPFIK